MGVSHANTYPRAKGKGHAITGIILGVLGFLCSPVWMVLIYFSYFHKMR